MPNPNLLKLSHDNLTAEVFFKGVVVAYRSIGGHWAMLRTTSPDDVYMACAKAIFSLPNDAKAEDIRRVAGENLEAQES